MQIMTCLSQMKSIYNTEPAFFISIWMLRELKWRWESLGLGVRLKRWKMPITFLLNVARNKKDIKIFSCRKLPIGKRVSEFRMNLHECVCEERWERDRDQAWEPVCIWGLWKGTRDRRGNWKAFITQARNKICSLPQMWQWALEVWDWFKKTMYVSLKYLKNGEIQNLMLLGLN